MVGFLVGRLRLIELRLKLSVLLFVGICCVGIVCGILLVGVGLCVLKLLRLNCRLVILVLC